MAIFLQIVSAGVTLISARFLLEAARVAPERFADEFFDVGFQGMNRRVRRFADQRANEQIGFAFLMIAFVSQMWDVLTPTTWGDFAVRLEWVVAAFALVWVVYLVGCWIRDQIARSFWDKVRDILRNQAIATDHWIYEENA